MKDSAFHYDIIADIHGRFDKLETLMARMGYHRNGAGFIPPTGHKALFLGDLIDPKPGQEHPGGVRSTLLAVKAMMDAENALCILGNHELNAILFSSRDSGGEYLRYHSEKNISMHRGTHADFADFQDPDGEWLSIWIPWLKRLPLFLDLGGLRAVHATWHPQHIAFLADKSLEDEAFLIKAADIASTEGKALETVLKGVEVALPEGTTYLDHTATSRRHIRARWWELPAKDIGYDGLVFPANPEIPASRVNPEIFGSIPSYPLDTPPVFFGHYFKPADSPLHPERHNVACIDHSAATNGPLVAYRWAGERKINPANYISSAPNQQ